MTSMLQESMFGGILPHELIIDNFAGGGGTSTGLEQALGRPVDIAINHDAKALAMHRANHPNTKHYCESVWDVNPIEVTQNQPVGLVWLSPDCKHFSKAKGGKPVEKKIRGLAWVALRWADLTRPRVIMLENVEEFKTWGDLGTDGRPCPKRKGRTFNTFINALKRQGYTVDYREIRACDYGAPTIRKRFFLAARRDGLPIRWPEPTHGNPASKEVLQGKLLPWRTAAEIIDWSIPCPSIFERANPLADATCRRTATGIMRYVVNNPAPFIVKSNHTASYYNCFRGQELSQPLQTVTSAPGFSLVAPVLTECANASSPRCMSVDEPLRTICAQTKGGHHALIAPFLAKNYTGVIGSPVTDPVHTITAKDHNSLVTANLSQAVSDHSYDVAAFIQAFYGSDKDGQSLKTPLRTVPTRDRFALVTVKINNVLYVITDIGFRMLQPHELFAAQGFPLDYIITYGIDEHGNQITLTKTDQTRMCGNSVCPPVAKALIEANFKHEKQWRAA